ncbi:MAG: aspartyl-tRNA amidotransferase [delta proteobacterium ML8_F1]|nr:MAG: aspartyl-tRNA amidotransferase [delta proteobacterium ML8_F1]
MKEKLMEDLKEAMRSKDVVRKNTLTMLRSQIKQVEVDTRTVLSESEIIDIIHKQVKQKKAALEEFEKANREDLVTEVQTEIEILTTYLPRQLPEEELRILVEDRVAAMGATSMKDMGRVMQVLKEETAGRADGRTLSNLVKEVLG